MRARTAQILFPLWWALPPAFAAAAVVLLFAAPPGAPVTRSLTEQFEPASRGELAVANSPAATIGDAAREPKIDAGAVEQADAPKPTELPAPTDDAAGAWEVSLVGVDLVDLEDEGRARAELTRYAQRAESCLAGLAAAKLSEGRVVLDFEPHWKRGGVPATAIDTGNSSKGLSDPVMKCFRVELPKDIGTPPAVGKAGRVGAIYSIAKQ